MGPQGLDTGLYLFNRCLSVPPLPPPRLDRSCPEWPRQTNANLTCDAEIFYSIIRSVHSYRKHIIWIEGGGGQYMDQLTNRPDLQSAGQLRPNVKGASSIYSTNVYIVVSELNDPICHSDECQIGSFSSEATIYTTSLCYIYLNICLSGIRENNQCKF